MPIFGWALKFAGMVNVDRYNKDKSKKAVDQGIRILKNTDLSILVYPEGTRTNYNKLSNFKKGAIILSINAKTPILPTGGRLPKFTPILIGTFLILASLTIS